MTVPHHALTAAQFDGLAAGYGSPDAVRVLREGQLTKRKLLLQALMEATDPGSPAMDLLIRADEADRDATAELLWHPHLDVWAGQALRTGEGTGYLAQVAAAAGVRAALPFRLEVPVTHGEVYLPGLGALAHEGATAVVTPDTVGAEGWEPLRTVELEPGYAVAIEDLEPYRDCYHWRPAPRLDEAAAAHFAGLLREAWQITTRRHPGHADAMRILLRSIVPLATPGTGGNVSAASRQASGSVAVVIPATAEELCLLLIHEFMHMKLDALRDLVDLHHPAGEPRFLAPWRMDPRPVGPLFQGVYAHAGVTDYWRLRRAEPDAPPAAVVEFGYWRHQNWLAVGALSDSGELTPEGERFVHGLHDTLATWQDEQIPADTSRWVEAMVLAQTIRWRLRNWRPADTELAALLAAWRAGRDPEPLNPAGILRTNAEGEPSALPGIVGAIRTALVGGPAGEEAEQAYLHGDEARAAELYAARLPSGYNKDWVGFALAVADDETRGTVCRRRPDLVRALTLALTAEGHPVDVAAVSLWLGTGSSFGS